MNTILKLYNGEFVMDLFKKEVLPKYPEFSDIQKIEIHKHKTNIWENTYHVVIEFKTYFVGRDKNKKESLKPIFCVAHSDEPRKNVHIVLEYLWGHGFNKGNLTIPKPLFYSDYFNGTFYEGVAGMNLYQFVRINDRAKIEEIIPKAAQWFAKLHSMTTERAHNFNQENSRIDTVFPGVEHIINRIENQYPEYVELYRKAYDYFIKEEESFLNREGRRWVIHGDAHPENVIRMSGKKIAIIDYTDMCLSDFARDLGCFMQQIEYMIMRKICDQKYADEIKLLFLDNYLKNTEIILNEDLRERIDIYFHWTAIRTATFFLIKDKPEPDRAKMPIESLKKYLANLK